MLFHCCFIAVSCCFIGVSLLFDAVSMWHGPVIKLPGGMLPVSSCFITMKQLQWERALSRRRVAGRSASLRPMLARPPVSLSFRPSFLFGQPPVRRLACPLVRRRRCGRPLSARPHPFYQPVRRLASSLSHTLTISRPPTRRPVGHPSVRPLDGRAGGLASRPVPPPDAPLPPSDGSVGLRSISRV